jgi:hypothetical protein
VETRKQSTHTNTGPIFFIADLLGVRGIRSGRDMGKSGFQQQKVVAETGLGLVNSSN